MTLSLIREMGSMTTMALLALIGMRGQRGLLAKLVRAVYEIGVRCIPITLIVGLFTGLVLGLQGYYTLVRFGSESLLGSAVALTLIREIGPVLTALMIVGQAGSAMAAEIGIQRNAEQIDALETMNVNPLGYLVAMRLVAALICFPLLTAFFDIVGMLGGYISGVVLLYADEGTFWQQIYLGVTMRDVMTGFIKAITFGALTTLICCYLGYHSHRLADTPGARGVSQATTRAVVISSITILVSDFLLTSLLLDI